MLALLLILLKKNAENQTMKKNQYAFFVLLAMLPISSFFSCGGFIRSMVVDQTKPLIRGIQDSFLLETDVQAAKSALPMTIKMAEGFYKYYPHSPYYSSKLAFLYSAYGFAFLDDAPYSDFDETAEDKIAMANAYYKKSIRYATLSLERSFPKFKEDIKQPKTRKKLLVRMKKQHVEALCWFNFSSAMLIFNDLGDPSKVILLEAVFDIAKRLETLSPDYMGGLNYGVLIAYYGGRTEVLGGDLQKANAYYKKAKKSLALKNASMVCDYVYLRFVATQSVDETSFENTYETMKSFQKDLKMEEQQKLIFLNKVLQGKARTLFERKGQFFF